MSHIVSHGGMHGWLPFSCRTPILHHELCTAVVGSSAIKPALENDRVVRPAPTERYQRDDHAGTFNYAHRWAGAFVVYSGIPGTSTGIACIAAINSSIIILNLSSWTRGHPGRATRTARTC